MKKLLLIISLAFPLGSLIAQPQGQRPEGPPPREMNRDHRPSAHNETKPILDQFPDIPNLTLQQREKIGTILTKERSDIDKQIDTKRKIEIELREEITEKEQRKLQNKIEKSDNKVQSIIADSDKKIKKILTEDQYIVFKQKRNDFRFKKPNAPNFRPKRDERIQRESELEDSFNLK